MKTPVDIELFIGRFLRVAVTVSGIVIAVGLVLFLLKGQSGYPEAQSPTTLRTIIPGVLALKPFAIIALGLYLLIFTPICRVALSIIFFAKERDVAYIWITAIVLGILCISLGIGAVT